MSVAAAENGNAGAPHVGMGHGVPYCLGAALARLQAQVAFPALLSGLPDLALAAEPTWRVGMPTRGMQALHVTFTPGAGADARAGAITATPPVPGIG